MRIVSLNAWAGRLHGPVMDYLAAVDADVLCLQEVCRTPDARTGWLTYREPGLDLPQRANFFDEVAAILPGHDGVFCPTASGPLYDGDAVLPSQFGLASFVRKSIPVIAQAVDFVHGHYTADGWGAHPRARNAHCLRVVDPATGNPVTIAQMHGLREVSGKADTPARHAQADALVALIQRVWSGSEPLIVCGDFNVLPDSVTFDALARLGLRDLVTANGFSDTRTSHYAKPGRFADYMLVTADVAVKAFDVVAQPEVSDHRPLLLDIA